MIGWIADLVRRNRLRPIVASLPHILRRRHGSSEHYSAGQVTSAAGLLGLSGRRLGFAYAMACDASEFRRAMPGCAPGLQESMRRQLGRLFWIDEERLNCRDLTRKFDNPVGAIDDSNHVLRPIHPEPPLQ